MWGPVKDAPSLGSVTTRSVESFLESACGRDPLARGGAPDVSPTALNGKGAVGETFGYPPTAMAAR